jgi:hypothetical protein
MAQAKSSKIFQIFNIGITAVPFGKRSRGPTIKISSAEKLKSVSTVRHRVARQRCSCVPSPTEPHGCRALKHHAYKSYHRRSDGTHRSKVFP